MIFFFWVYRKAPFPKKLVGMWLALTLKKIWKEKYFPLLSIYGIRYWGKIKEGVSLGRVMISYDNIHIAQRNRDQGGVKKNGREEKVEA